MKKKVFSKSMSWILSVVMMFGMFIIAPTVSVSASVSHSRDEAVAWAKSKIGSKIDVDGAYGAQCVDLIMAYYQYLGVSRVSGNGCDYSHNSLPNGWVRIQNSASFVPNPGDIVVWTDEGWKNGHVAIFLSGDASSFTSIDQNWPQGSAVKEVYHSSYKYVWGVIRPDFTSNGSDSSTFYGLSKVDRGTNFYGLIIRNENWAHISDENGDVKVNNNGNIVWYFTKTSDGGYKIRNVATGKYLDVNGGYDKDDNNVQTWEPNDTAAQVWYIYGPWSGEYVFKPKCTSNKVLNVYGPTGDATTWTFNPDDKDMRFALWDDISTYTVSYNMNGGSGSIANQTKVQYSPLTLSGTKPTRTGYEFVGWNTNASATTAQYQPSGKYTANSGATLYAIWKANTYTVSYNMNGGSGSIGNQTKTYGQDLTLSSTKPTRIGYEFVGWNSSASATTAQYQPGGKYTANSGATLYAIWKINTWTVSYNMNGGSGSIGNQTKTYGQDLTLSSTKPTRTGYSFVCWNTKSDGTGTNYNPSGKYTSNSGATLYAIWKADTYTVSYNMNGGSGSISNQTKTYGQELTLSSTKPTRTGYSFVCWNTKSDGTGTNYNPSGKYTANSGATLYAIWKINTWTVSYNMNGGSGSISNQTKTYGQDLTLSNTKPTRTGYEFVGWSTNKDATSAQYAAGGKYTANSGATLYAIWKINTWTVSYNMNGGSGSISNQTKTYGQDLTLSSTKPTRTGYEFVGWNTSASATTAQYQPGGKYTVNSSATLYAIWKAKQVTVTFYRNQNGSDNTAATQTFTYGASGQSFSNKNWTKDGYTLLGWSENRNATDKQYSTDSGVDPNWILQKTPSVNLYAVWKANTYTVSYNMNGGSGSIANQTKTYGQDLILSSTKPTRKGYDFIGWNTNASATTAQYQSGGKYTANSDATLYAIWQKVNYDAAPDAKSEFRGNTYEFYTQKLSWDHAYKFCEKKGGHLVTINSKEENDFVVELTKDSNDSLWMGGRTQDHKVWYWITGEPFDYQNWSEGEPNNYGGNQDVIKLYRSGKWDDDGSSYLHGFICEYDSGIDLSKYEPVYKENYNDHAYWFFEDSVDWQTAKKICEAKGGYLAIPNDTDENAFILSGINNTTKEETWIGVTDIAEEGVWRDVKGSVIKYSNWDNNQPDNYLDREDYAHMYSNGKWNDEKSFRAMYCSLGFVCEFDDLCTANGHNYIDTVVAPTITEQGYTIHTCSVCGHSYKDAYTNKLLDNTATLSATALKLGTTLTINASATGGIGGYTYAVYYKKSSSTSWTTKQNYSTNATIKIKPASAEKYDISVKVKDSEGTIVKKSFTVNVFAPLKNTTTVSSTSIGYGGTFTVKAKATGGLGDYTYAVYYKKASATKWTTAQNYSSTKTVTIKPKYAEEYDVSVKVKDSRGVVAKKTFKIKVTKPTNTSKVASTTITLGNTIDITCSATGGSGFYQYAVYYKKSSDTSWKTKQSYSSNTNVSIKPASKTKYDVSVKVKDSLGNVSKQTFTITVK